MRIDLTTFDAASARILRGGAAVLIAVAAAAAGCARERPSAASNLVLTTEEAAQRVTLSPAEQAEVLEAMRSVKPGYVPGPPPGPAPEGVRWSDLAVAVGAACDDVETAVVHTKKERRGRRWRFTLRTVEDWPGELVVCRVDGPEVYEARATIGRFPEEPERQARADALVRRLRVWMEALGGRPGFAEE